MQNLYRYRRNVVVFSRTSCSNLSLPLIYIYIYIYIFTCHMQTCCSNWVSLDHCVCSWADIKQREKQLSGMPRATTYIYSPSIHCTNPRPWPSYQTLATSKFSCWKKSTNMMHCPDLDHQEDMKWPVNCVPLVLTLMWVIN